MLGLVGCGGLRLGVFEFRRGVVELVMGMLGLVGTGGFSRSLVSNGFWGIWERMWGFKGFWFSVCEMILQSDGE